VRTFCAVLIALAGCHKAPASGDSARLAHAIALVAEDYGEAIERPGQLERRRPALQRLLDQSAEWTRDPAIKSAIAGLRARLQKPVDYDFWQDATKLAASIETAAHFPTAPPSKPDLARGERLYQTACFACHGDARPEIRASMDPPPPPLESSEKNWRPYDMFARVTWGGLETAMPAFGDTMSVQDRWDVVFYLFAVRWPPCTRDAPAMTAAKLAISSDFDLSGQVPYAAIGFVRRNFK
jgi:mono/diheme cytochrome c family protein